MTRFDHHRPEPADVQARVQLATAAKRERKRRARVRHAELTALGRALARADVAERTACRRLDESEGAMGAAANIAYWAAADASDDAFDALAARRAQP